MPRVTVVLPVYNHDAFVQQTLSSLYAQDYCDFQIVAVADGSTDGSLEIRKRQGSRVQVIESRHQGPAGARNRGLSETDSDFVAFMDADDLCAPERLRVELETLEKENLDLVASAMNFIDAEGHPLPGTWTCPVGAAGNYWAALLERNWIGTPSVIVRRSVFDTIGVFDEGFTHAEDYDLWLRIGRTHAIGYIDTPLISCRRHAMNTSINIESHQRFESLALQKVDRGEAWAAFGRLYKKGRHRSEAWIWFLLRRGDPAFAREAARAVAQHPNSRSIRFAVGVFQYDCGLYEKSLVTFDSLKQGDAAAMHNMGVVYARCGMKEAAAVQLEAALQLRPGYFDAEHNLAALRNGQDLRLTRRPFREHSVPMPGTKMGS